MTDWNLYEQRLGVFGDMTRSRILKSAEENLLAHKNVHPACKEFFKGKKRVNLLVRSTADGYTYIFNVLPGQKVSLHIGDIVSYKNTWFIVTEKYFDDDHVERGQMEQCNHVFRFQNGTPKIIEVRGIVENPYSRSNISGKVVEEPFNQVKFIMPKNADTEKIYLGKRFIVEVGYNQNGDLQPFVYRVVMLGSATDQYDDGGLLTLSLEYAPAEDDDNIDEMIANYIAPEEASSDTPSARRAEIHGSDRIKVGMGWYTYEAHFYNSSGDEYTGVTLVWSFDTSAFPDRAVETDIQDGNLSIRAIGGLDCVGKTIRITCRGVQDLVGTLDVKVVAPY